LTKQHVGVRLTASQLIPAMTMAAALKSSSPKAAVELMRSSMGQMRRRSYDAEAQEIERHMAGHRIDRMFDVAPGQD
jgi:hypothetical protein